LQYAKNVQSLRIVYFETDTNNSIDYDDSGVATNAYKSTNKGFESTGRAEWGGVLIKATIVFQNPKNLTYDEALARRAKRYGSIDLTKRIHAYDIGMKIFASSERKDSHYSTDILSSYTLLSVYASRQLGNDWTARVRIHNLLDESYQLAYGYNTPGRMVTASLNYRFH
jgi:vitamin B12 transporter